jgi:glycosyltransferase involved in cell wall biosynthesis
MFAHKVIAVSAKVRNEIMRLPFVGKEKVSVVHNGIDDIEYAERFSARATIAGKVTEKFWIGTIAELHHNKGLDILIRAFAHISKEQPDTTLLIIGEGEERKRLMLLIHSLNLSKKVHLIGFIDNARAYLKAFDVFVLSSRTEAFPYVPLEAGLAQLPVVTTRVGGIPEVISDGKNGLLVEKENVNQLAAAIQELLQDSTKAAVFGHNLRKTVEENYSIHSMVQKTIAIYN